MSVRRRVALGGGLLAAAVGLALAVQPSLLSEPDLGEWAVSVLGAIALLYAASPLYRRRKRAPTVAGSPEPETPLTPPTPGEDVDDLLAVAGDVHPRTVRRRRRLRRRLHAAAVAAVERREACDEETARRMVAAGTWTDDPVAASYFTDGAVVAPEDVPLQQRIRLRLSGAARRAYAVHRVADEVATMTEPGTDGPAPPNEGDGPPGPEDEPPGPGGGPPPSRGPNDDRARGRMTRKSGPNVDGVGGRTLTESGAER